MELTLTINRHPQSAFQPFSSFHQKRQLCQIDSRLDSHNDSLRFNSVFEEAPQEGLLNLKSFPAKRLLQLCQTKEEVVQNEQEDASTVAGSKFSSPELKDEKLPEASENSEMESDQTLEDDGKVDMQALLLQVQQQHDLNQAVVELLEKPLSDEENREIKRRQRKGKEQLALLEEEYKKNSQWNRAYMQQLAKKLGFSFSQVYKWHWDQRQK